MLAILCKLALAALAFVLAGGLRGRFWTAVLTSAVAQFVLAAVPALPVYASLILFGIELLLLMEARNSGDVRRLYWIAPLFLLWANLDPNFVIGIFVLCCFAQQP